MGFPWLEMYPQFLHRRSKWDALRAIIYDPNFKFQDELEADDWFDEVKVNEDLRKGLIRDGLPSNITDKFLERMLKPRCSPKHNYALVIVGPPGAGKTVLAAILTWETKGFVPDMDQEVATSFNQLIDSFVASKHHKVSVFDENLESTDIGTETIRTHVTNFMKELREFEHNLIYEIKWFENIPFANYYLIMFGYNEESGETRALVRSQRGHYLGFIILKKQYDEAHFEPFAQAKPESFKKLQQNRGKIDAFDGLDKEAIAQALIETIKTNNLCVTRNSEVVEIFDMHEFKEKYPEISVSMQEKKIEIARQVLIRLKGNRQPIDKIHTQSKAPAKVLSENVYPDPKFLRKQLDLAPHLIPEPYLTTFKLKAQHQSNLEISRIAGIATGSASNYLNVVQQNWLGDLGELAHEEELKEKGEYFIHEGGNSDEPDFTLFYDAAHTQIKEIRSLKNYVYFRRNKALTEIGKKEVVLAQKTGAPLFEYCYEIDKEAWHIFQLDPQGEIIDDDDSSRVGPTALPTEIGLNTPSPPSPAPEPPTFPPSPPPLEGGCSMITAEQSTKQERKKRRRHRR
jgi:hypothetical protein